MEYGADTYLLAVKNELTVAMQTRAWAGSVPRLSSEEARQGAIWLTCSSYGLLSSTTHAIQPSIEVDDIHDD